MRSTDSIRYPPVCSGIEAATAAWHPTYSGRPNDAS